MKRVPITEQLADLQTAVDAVIKERDSLRSQLRSVPLETVDAGEVGRVLMDALGNKSGWREEARRVLGLQWMIACESCDTLFPSGGKRGKFCSEECRKLSR